MLYDNFNRIHNYLRISITDKCNFRCSYCMPEECYTFTPSERLMNAAEIEAIAREFVSLGINKLRLTGGEPLLRKDFADILTRLSKLNIELLITTNGLLLNQYIDTIKAAKVSTINVSLDSLNPETFFQITKRNAFKQVWDNIMLLLQEGIRVKINVVAIKEFITKEIFDFLELTKNLPLHIRFIEFMPFAGNNWTSDNVVTAAQLLKLVSEKHNIVKLIDEPHATARKYKVVGYEGTFAFITTMTNQFCGDCNRVRLTADGKLKNCLFSKEETDLLTPFRKNEPIVPLIVETVKRKYPALGGQFQPDYQTIQPQVLINRSMIGIGG